MPTRRKTQPSGAASKTYKRRVRAQGITYSITLPGFDGRLVRVFEDASMGDEIQVDAMEAMRLDVGGTLAPPGWSKADVEAEHAAKIAAYRAQRSSASLTA